MSRKTCRKCGAGCNAGVSADGLCSKCAREEDMTAMKKVCRKCGRRVYKTPADGLCSRCREEQKQKYPKNPKWIKCKTCGKRCLGVTLSGEPTDRCSECRKYETVRSGTDKPHRVKEAEPDPERISREFHAKYGAAGLRIDEICRQDAENRKAGKHLSYGMRMAGKK